MSTVKAVTLSQVTDGAIKRAISDLGKSFANGKARAFTIAETIIVLGQKTGDYQRFNQLCRMLEQGNPSVLKAIISYTEGRIPHALRKKPNGDYLGKRDETLLMNLDQLTAKHAAATAKREQTSTQTTAKREETKTKAAAHAGLVARVKELEDQSPAVKAKELTAAKAAADKFKKAAQDAQDQADKANRERQAAETKAAKLAAELEAEKAARDQLQRDFNSLTAAYQALKLEFAKVEGRLFEVKKAA